MISKLKSLFRKEPDQDIEWLTSKEEDQEGQEENNPLQREEVQPFLGQRIFLDIETTNFLTVEPKSFPLILQFNVNGRAKTIRIELPDEGK